MINPRLIVCAVAFLLTSHVPLAQAGQVPLLPVKLSCFVLPPYDGTLKFLNEGPGTAPANSIWQWSFGFPGPAMGYCRLGKPLPPHTAVVVSTGHITSFISTCEVKRVYLLPKQQLPVVPICGSKP